jgi:hypothetical protein
MNYTNGSKVDINLSYCSLRKRGYQRIKYDVTMRGNVMSENFYSDWTAV